MVDANDDAKEHVDVVGELERYEGAVIPQLRLDLHAIVCSFLTLKEQLSFVSTTKSSLQAALLIVSPTNWPQLYKSQGWFMHMLQPQQKSNDVVPMRVMRNLRLGLNDVIDSDFVQYLSCLYISVTDVTITLPRTLYDAIRRFHEALTVVAPLMGYQGQVIFSADTSHRRGDVWDWQDEVNDPPLSLLEGGGDDRVGYADYPTAVMLQVESFEKAHAAKGLRVRFEGLGAGCPGSNVDRPWHSDGMGCGRCSSLAQNLSLDTLASIIVFQALGNIRYHVAGRVLHGQRSHYKHLPFTFGFNFLCSEALSYSPGPDKYKCEKSLHCLLGVYESRKRQCAPSRFCDLSCESLDFYATFYGIVHTIFVDTRRVKVDGCCPARVEAISRIVEVRDAVTEEDLHDYVQYVVGLITDRKISCETMINLVQGDLLLHLTSALPTDFKETTTAYREGVGPRDGSDDSLPGWEQLDTCFLDGVNSSKVVYGYRLRELMRTLGDKCRERSLFDLLPAHISMHYYYNPTVYDIIGFGEVLFEQYIESDGKPVHSTTDDLMYAVFSMYSYIRYNKQFPKDPMCDYAEQHTVHLITTHLRKLLDTIDFWNGMTSQYCFRGSFVGAFNLINETFKASQLNGIGSSVAVLMNVHDNLLFSRSMDRSPHTNRIEIDVYGDDNIMTGGYHWRDLLSTIFMYLEEAQKWYQISGSESAHKLFYVCKNFLLQERRLMTNAFPRIGAPPASQKKPSHRFICLPEAAVELPSYDITLTQSVLLSTDLPSIRVIE